MRSAVLSGMIVVLGLLHVHCAYGRVTVRPDKKLWCVGEPLGLRLRLIANATTWSASWPPDGALAPCWFNVTVRNRSGPVFSSRSSRVGLICMLYSGGFVDREFPASGIPVGVTYESALEGLSPGRYTLTATLEVSQVGGPRTAKRGSTAILVQACD